MNSQKTANTIGTLLRSVKTILAAGSLPALVLLLSIEISQADSATWSLNPINGDWNTSTNWTPATVPNGSADTATFATSNRTNVSILGFTVVSDIVFNAGASAFTITISPGSSTTNLFINGDGITNDSAIAQNIVTAVDEVGNYGFILFTNSSSAGKSTSFDNVGAVASGAQGGATGFYDASRSGSSTFITHAGAVSGAYGSHISFYGTASGDSATFINNGGLVQGAINGGTSFHEFSTAGAATFTNNGGTSGATGSTQFYDTSNAGTSTFINRENGFIRKVCAS